MKRVKLICKLGIACLMICALCPALFAQDAPTPEIFGGLSILSGGGNMAGLGLSGAYYFNEKLAAKVDVDALFAGVEGCNDCSAKQFNILFGAQYSAMRTEKLNIFAEGLVGVGRASSTVKIPAQTIPGYGTVPGETVSGSNTDFAIAFGGGVDWKFSEKLAWRVGELDFLHAGGNGFRFRTGILYYIGSK